VEHLERRHLLAAQPIITEFVANNGNGLADSDGDHSDWIELFNAGDADLDLAGWSLTDTYDEPVKWVFPSIVLGRGEYLVVYASGKDRRDVANELHTNFQLDADGEYLALIHPDGTTRVSSFGSEDSIFPRQREDISYGTEVEASETTLVDSSASYVTYVPTASNGGSSLGATWTGGNEPFNSSNWTTRTSGLGYDATSGGGSFQRLDDFESLTVGSLDSQNGWTTSSSSVAVAADPVDPTNQVLRLTSTNQVVYKPLLISNANTASTLFFRMRRDGQTNFSAGTSDIATPTTNFADYETQLNLQDGTGTSTPVDQLNVRDGGTFRALDTWLDNTWYDVWMVVNNASNTYQVFMQGGNLAEQTQLDAGALTTFGFRNGAAANPLVQFLLRTGNNHIGASYVDDIYLDTTGVNLDLPFDVDFGSAIHVQGNVATAMQGINASLFARTGFHLDNPSALNSLRLDIQYDDGFVAYLNGVEVARRNAPGVTGSAVAWNAEATSVQADRAALAPETIDLTPNLSALRTGANVLAIQGLNIRAADEDFLLVPTLTATSLNDTATEKYFLTPTPGGLNDHASSVHGFVSDTTFSGDPLVFHDRGFYTAPFDVVLSSPSPGATLVYTIDGSQPTLTNGTSVPAADDTTFPSVTLPITQTTTLRVAAFKADNQPTNVDTQTYIFADQVILQSGSGLPASWGSAPAVDYEMDADIYDDPAYQDQIVSSLMSLPTVSLTMDVADLWGPSGIYSNTMQQGTAWERAASLELIYPDGTAGFQINAGVQIQGGASREVLKSPKHSFRVLFKEQWGPSKLDFPLFGEDATDQFDAILLRAGFNNTWIHWDPTQRLHGDYVRDSWANATQRAMGHVSKHDTFVHLYINGLYWGMYNLAERPEESFMSTYFGGEKEDWDVINNQVSVINGDVTAWNEMMAIANSGVADNASYQAIQRYLDIDNFIDYMIMNYYGANTDWDDHNWYAARRSRVGGETIGNAELDPEYGFKFFNFDGEHLIELPTDDRLNVNNANRPTRLHNQLMANAEYRLQFADRIQHHLFNDGALTSAHAGARYAEIANRVELAVIAESARWGDYRRDVHPYQNPPYSLYTQQSWLTEQTRMRESYFPVRTSNAINQLIAKGWFPNVGAPSFSVDGQPQYGGNLAPGANITISGNVGDIYYTLDGTDPRAPVEIEQRVLLDEFAPATALMPTSAADGMDAESRDWFARDFTESPAWRSGNTGAGYERTIADYGGLIQLNYPEMDGGNTSLYVRIPFDIPDSETLANISALTLNMKYDDGFRAYINGVPVAAMNAPATLAWNSAATAGHADSAAVAFESFSIDLNALRNAGGELVVGRNLLAIHGLNTDSGSSDLLILPQLVASQAAIGQGLSESAILYNGEPIVVDQTTRLRARLVDGDTVMGTWSPISDATFIVHSVQPGDLAITEINYHPSLPTEQELAVIPTLTDNDFEFIEITNTSDALVSLIGAHFTSGIDFVFPHADLAPGEYGIIARNTAAFQLRYGTGLPLLGEFASGSLSNAGERIVLNSRDGSVLFDMEYSDNVLWPLTADGAGATLVNNEPNSAGDGRDSLYSRWSGSTEFGGSPGTASATPVGIVINEVLSHTDLPLTTSDSIELHNRTNAPIEIGGWYLSDSLGNPWKFRIPENSVIPAGAYLVFDETDFNPEPLHPGPNHFALNATTGDQVVLVVPDDSGEIHTFVDAVQFGAARNGESLGRVPDGSGRLAPMNRTTLGCTNSTVRVGPLVISEISYAPAHPSPEALVVSPTLTPGDLEFTEVHNPTLVDVELTNWRIRGGIEYDFPEGMHLSAGATLILVSFNPSAPANAARTAGFRTHYGLAPTISLIGGYSGSLSNESDRIQLQRPDAPSADDPTQTPHLYEDEVTYEALNPWPSTSDATALSLTRTTQFGYGNAPIHWVAATPSPGSVHLTNLAYDFTADGQITAADIDAYYDAIRLGSHVTAMDLDMNGIVDGADVVMLLNDAFDTRFGDINLDGTVDGSDFNRWNQHKFTQCGSSWASGDLNGDTMIDAGDFNIWLSNRFTGRAATLESPAHIPRAAAAIGSRGVPVEVSKKPRQPSEALLRANHARELRSLDGTIGPNRVDQHDYRRRSVTRRNSVPGVLLPSNSHTAQASAAAPPAGDRLPTSDLRIQTMDDVFAGW
jgi:hypothetical protein